RQYEKVHAALDLLGRSDPLARTLQQTARETLAAANLIQPSLFDLLRDAADAAQGRSNLSWDETFKTSYRDRWIVMDTLVVRAADTSTGRRFDVLFPLTEGTIQGIIIADLEIFDKLPDAGG